VTISGTIASRCSKRARWPTGPSPAGPWPRLAGRRGRHPVDRSRGRDLPGGRPSDHARTGVGAALHARGDQAGPHSVLTQDLIRLAERPRRLPEPALEGGAERERAGVSHPEGHGPDGFVRVGQRAGGRPVGLVPGSSQGSGRSRVNRTSTSSASRNRPTVREMRGTGQVTGQVGQEVLGLEPAQRVVVLVGHSFQLAQAGRDG
jgi:hypothetical protein